MANPPVDFRLLAGAGVPARDFKAGDVIFRQGDPAQELFIIQSGEVEIRLGNRMLERLPQYSIFGEMALIDNATRSATAIARRRRQTGSGQREAVFVSDQQHAVFRAQCHARYGAAFARREHRPVVTRRPVGRLRRRRTVLSKSKMGGSP
jgi:cyclic nucleotide-binding protein